MNGLLPQQHHLSFSQCPLFCNPIKHLTFLPKGPARASSVIRMGGGPRTYPGGVSKWQWKRMQAKKAKQLLKARLSRERQIYEMRKRAELKAAVSELERPWEVVERVAEAAPNLFSVGADEQVKVLADRFQKPGGFDMWSEKDGPVLFETPDELPSARFFPKGVVHSIKPYRRVDGYGLIKGGYDLEDDGEEGLVTGNDLSEMRNGIEFGGGGNEVSLEDDDGSEWESDDGECSSSSVSYGWNGMEGNGDSGLRRNGNGRRFLSDDVGSSSRVSYKRNGVEGDGNGGLRRNGNRRRFLSDDVGSSSRVSYKRNGVEGDGNGGLRRNGNGRRFLSDDVGSSSRVSYKRNGVEGDGDGDGGLRRNGNGRRFLSDDVGRSSRSTHRRNGVNDELRRNGNERRFLSSSDGEQSSTLNYGRNGVGGDGRARKNRNGRRFSSDNVDWSSDGEESSPLNYGRNVVDGDGRSRRNGNGRRVLSDNVGSLSDGGCSSRLNDERRVDGRMRRNGNGSKYASRGFDGANDGEHSPRSSRSGWSSVSFGGKLRNRGNGRRVLSKDVGRSGDGEFRSKENGRSFMSKDVDGSNGLYSGGVGSFRKQRGGNSIRGRSRGLDYASPRGRRANSEVYDMGLQQDGSYGFSQKHEQPDSTDW